MRTSPTTWRFQPTVSFPLVRRIAEAFLALGLLGASASAGDMVQITLGSHPNDAAPAFGSVSFAAGPAGTLLFAPGFTVPPGQMASQTAAAIAAAIGSSANAVGNTVTVDPAVAASIDISGGLYSPIRMQRILAAPPGPSPSSRAVQVLVGSLDRDGSLSETFSGPGFSITASVGFLAGDPTGQVNAAMFTALNAQSGALPAGYAFALENNGVALAGATTLFDVDCLASIAFVQPGIPNCLSLGMDLTLVQTGTLLTYCSSKSNSLGCLPVMGWGGTSSAAANAGFFVGASSVRNNKAGLLMYGTQGRNCSPFGGGILCVKPPVKRTPGTGSGGNPLPANDCSGLYLIDMNAFAAGAAGGTPSPALLIPGTVVNCQWWGRDPGFPAPNNTTLSNGLEYTVGT
jgi:hypothetical protein